MTTIKDRKQRLDICQKCEFYAYNICRICYCVVILKTNLENATCPKGKW
jgi:glycopeptide antibiotics resistance protein